ncbi:MAG: hypothetical protein KatS3mg070_1610 [Meiothermus sp.]|jgi:hypothetical protein|uniref:hypothetical protein n=1 Tax=Meiothermus TaxID=65551 RepID=UPI0021DBE0AF|nr:MULTISPECIES: hypothetical protein [Meiothermus]GIW28247.1 MAG: hypothetical protein KatS3mg070_1610 [Meiothermus sp.]
MRGFDLIALVAGVLGVVGLVAATVVDNDRIQAERFQVEAAAKPAPQITLDLTPEAMNICKRLFVRHMQGGHVDEYRCELRDGAIVLIGPNWRKAQGDKAPIEVLGREEL